MPDRPRAIIHLDLDAFFAAVEVLENPELEGQPVLVGGSPEGRGVVAAASYPARAYGIRSAMPTARALALCPHAIVLPARHRLYSAYSRRVMTILRDSAPLVEQMSVDEAFLDVTDRVSSWNEAPDLARQLQQRVLEDVGLSASLGIAANKLVAKIASDRDKPGGLTVVQPGEEAAFLKPLPVRVLWGVGPVAERKLAELGVTTVGDLSQVPERELRARFGKHGAALVRQAQGIDTRPLSTGHVAKSVSHERTFSSDLSDPEALEQQVRHLSELVAQRLAKSGFNAGTIGIKLRYSDFITLTRQMTLDVPTDDERQIFQTAMTLFQRAWQRGRPIRLLGVSARHLSAPPGQLPLW
jgi:DNA polymerase-4